MKSIDKVALKTSILLVAGILLMLATSPVFAAYTITDLERVSVYDINNLGQIVTSTGLYSNGTITALPAGARYINDFGLVVGNSNGLIFTQMA